MIRSILPLAWLVIVLFPNWLPAQNEFKVPDAVVFRRDVTFLAADREEKLDLYQPAKIEPGKALPAVVIIHGGGWVKGDKGRKREFVSGVMLAQAGYVAISVNYERRKGKRWPGNLHDCKNAVRWLRKTSGALQVDPARIGVIGGSAGGHLALMVAYTGDHPKFSSNDLYPGVSDKVSACVDMYGITNLLTRRVTDAEGNPTRELKSHRLFSKDRDQAPAMWRNASPVTYFNAKSPPTLIFHGTRDTVVDRDQSMELYKALQKEGVASELQMIEGAKHAWALNADQFDLRPQVIDFFNKHLKNEKKNEKTTAQSPPKSTKVTPARQPALGMRPTLTQGQRPNVLFIVVDDLND